jgi:hypothetical protein
VLKRELETQQTSATRDINNTGTVFSPHFTQPERINQPLGEDLVVLGFI